MVEIKGYRGEDARDKKATMEKYWIPAVNNLGTFERWAFAELTEMYGIESDFNATVVAAFDDMLSRVATSTRPREAPPASGRGRRTAEQLFS